MSEISSLPPNDPAELRAMIAALESENAAMRAETTRLTAVLKAHEALVQALQIRIAKLQRQKFGASSEKIEREIEQLELALEALEVATSAAREPEEEPEAEPAVAESKMNEDYEMTVDAEGVYGVKCTPHYGMGMVAVVQVGEAVNFDAASEVEQKGKSKARIAELLALVE